MANLPRRIAPIRLAKNHVVDYTESPRGFYEPSMEESDGNDCQAHTVRQPRTSVPFQNIGDAIRGGLAKPASEIPEERQCHVLGRCIADPDFYIISDGESHYAVAIDNICKYVPTHNIELFENTVFNYQETVMSKVDKKSRMSGMNPESALRRFTQAAWIIPTVCGTCYERSKTPGYSLAAHGETPRVPRPTMTPPAVAVKETVGVVCLDDSDSGSGSDSDRTVDCCPQPQKTHATTSACLDRIKSLEARLSSAQDFAQARSSKSLMNDRRKIQRLERDVHALEQRLRRHDEKEVMMEGIIARLMEGVSGGEAMKRALVEMREGEETEEELLVPLKRKRMESSEGK